MGRIARSGHCHAIPGLQSNGLTPGLKDVAGRGIAQGNGFVKLGKDLLHRGLDPFDPHLLDHLPDQIRTRPRLADQTLLGKCQQRPLRTG